MIGRHDAGAKPSRAPQRGRDVAANRLRAWAAEEAGQFILWVPVFAIVGIALYFSLRVEPPWWAGLIIVGSGGGLIAGARHGGAAALIGRIILCVGIGFVLMDWRSHRVDAPRIVRELPPLDIYGELIDVENRPGSQRLLIAVKWIEDLPETARPANVRLTWRGDAGAARPGDRVAIRGVLSPPPGPAMPGAFDYARQLYFEQIGGVGFALSAPEVVSRSPSNAFARRIDRLRSGIYERVAASAGPRAGPVLGALVTGRRGGIDPAITDQLRDTGLAHLLAISGLHMGLVCGFLFVALRQVFLFHPWWPACYPVKKWAALGALAGGLFYLMMSGGAWSAQRAFIMAAIGFCAILVDRKAISLRNVSFAAIIVLLLRPEAAISVGFQMSFGAVIALVAAYDAWRRYRPVDTLPGGRWPVPFRFLGGLTTTSFVAGGATAPFAIYHFNRMAVYGLGANVVVMPVFTLLVMPVAVMGLAVMPLGLDAPFWWLAGKGLEVILWLTEAIAGWRGAVSLIPQWPPVTFLLLVCALTGMSLLRAPWRLALVILVPLGLVLAELAPRPDIMVADAGRNIGVPTDEGMALASRRRERFTAGMWLEAAGIDVPSREQPKFGECGEDPCFVETLRGDVLALADTVPGAAFACREADVVIARIWDETRLPAGCRAFLLSSEALADLGPASLTRQGAGWHVRGVTPERGQRPWTDE